MHVHLDTQQTLKLILRFSFLIIVLFFSYGRGSAQNNMITDRDLKKFPFALLDGESVSLYADLAIARKADPNRSSFNNVGPMSAADAMTELWNAEKNFRGNRPWTSLMVVNRVLKPYNSGHNLETLNTTLLHVIARAFADRGIMNHHMGLLQAAEKAAKISLDMRETRFGPDHIASISSLNNLAALYKDMGKYAESETMFSEALLRLKNSNMFNSMERAIVLNNQSMLYLAQGRNDEAEKILLIAITIADNFSRSRSKDFLPFLVNKALVYWSKGDLNQAVQILANVKEVKEKRFGKKTTQYARALNHLAAIKMELGDRTEIEVLLNTSFEIYKKVFGENHPTTANIMGNLGKFFLLTKQYERAEKQLLRVKKLQSYILNKYHPDYLSTLESLAVCYWKNDKLLLAKSEFELLQIALLQQIENYFPALGEEEKTKFWYKSRPYLMTYYSFIVNNISQYPGWASDLYTMHLATKGLLFDTTIGIKREILSSGKPALIEKYQKWLSLTEGLITYQTLPKSQLFAMGINVLNEEKKVNELAEELSLSSYKFSSAYGQKTPKFEDVRSKVNHDEALVEIVHLVNEDGKPDYAAFVITKEDEFPRLVRIEKGVDLEGKFLSYYRSSIKFKTEDKLSYANYWLPIAIQIKDKVKVLLSLDGVYSQISIPTLRSPEGDYLIDVKSFQFIPSGKQLLITEEETQLESSILIGNPSFESTKVADLPATGLEVEQINGLMNKSNLKVTVLVESQATEGRIKQSSGPSILHFATHGFFLKDTDIKRKNSFGLSVPMAIDNPLLRCGLILANDQEDHKNDGILTAHEVMNFELKNTHLVVLSACETGLGEIKVGEGVYGLQRSFQIAGANAVIISLWQVDDKATQELMTSFYGYWLTGDDINQALIKAQKKTRETHREPYYWGAFMLLN